MNPTANSTSTTPRDTEGRRSKVRPLQELALPLAAKNIHNDDLFKRITTGAPQLIEKMRADMKKEDQIKFFGEHRTYYTPLNKKEKPTQICYTHKYNAAGQRDGPSIEYWPNGEISSIVSYKDGLLHGDAKYFSQKAEPRTHFVYVDGKREGRQQEWFRNGVQYADYYCKDGLKHGKCVMQFKKGIIEFDYTYHEGKLHGEQKEFHRTGKLYLHNNFTHGKREGFWNTWYETGDRSVESAFVNDKQEGERKKWSKSGQLTMHEHYHEDKRHGEFKEWSSWGTLSEHKRYANGDVAEDYLHPKMSWGNRYI